MEWEFHFNTFVTMIFKENYIFTIANLSTHAKEGFHTNVGLYGGSLSFTVYKWLRHKTN
jgi:hypothetical protein